MADFLYNGVRLPDVYTAWTGEYSGVAVPYGTIFAIDNGHRLVASTAPLIHVDDNICSSGRITFVNYFNDYDYLPTEWRDGSTGFNTTFTISASRCVWSSYDILNDDGSVYLSASDPIPANPAPTLDPTALLMGLQVGNRIRQRGGV